METKKDRAHEEKKSDYLAEFFRCQLKFYLIDFSISYKESFLNSKKEM
jgi:hypothetical protein